MEKINRQAEIQPKVLATDLDGTFIPLEGEAGNREDLETLRKAHADGNFQLIFATGRHFSSVEEAIREENLPVPEWVVCDVGTSIYRREGDVFSVFSDYRRHLSEKVGEHGREMVEKLLAGIGGLTAQTDERQGEFKISYESEPETVEDLVEKVNEDLREKGVPYGCMGSVDPFLKIGLLDVLPEAVSKAYALEWLAEHAGYQRDEVVFSGDSGNDFAALSCGFRAIVVANASEGLAEKTRAGLAERGLEERLFVAGKTATSGVLEGCRFFGLVV